MKQTCLIFTILTCMVKISGAQNIDSIVNQVATSFMASGPRVGVSIAVIKDNRTYQYNFGSTQKDKVKVPDANTIYEIGSMTKTFTSMLLAQAVTDKKVNLTDDIRKYLKDSYPDLEYKGKPIQLVHLANLTSALPDNLPVDLSETLPLFKTQDKDAQLFEIKKFYDTYSREQFLKDLKGVKLTAEPGLNTAHSNTAAQLLGFILENIYKKSYHELLKEYITAPLDMKSTFVAVPDPLKERIALGYNNNGLLMPEIPIGAGSAGVLKSTLPDMAKYITHHFQEKDQRVILDHKLTWGKIESFGIGLNWFLRNNFDGKKKIWASGGTFGFCSYGVLYPERKFAVIVLANETDGSAEEAASNMAETIYNEVYFTETERSSEGFGYVNSTNLLLEVLNKRGFEHALKQLVS